jgi:S-adenosylmethionine synthetase
MYPQIMFFTSESVAEAHPDKFCDQMNTETTRLRFVLVLMGAKRRGETSRQQGLVAIY